MAESLDDGKFWLPPRFLADDDIFVERQSSRGVLHRKDAKDGVWCDADGFSKPPFPLEFPYGFESFNWDLSSPVSTETESDEEDYLAGLTRQMARSTLEDRHDLAFSKENAKGYFTTGSPQSTLSPVSARCGCRQGSGHGSPNGCCKVSSPPATWDLLYAAAGEVERMRRMNQEGYAGGFESNNRGGGGGGGGVLGPPRKRSPVSTLPVKNPNLDAGLYPQQSLSYQKLQASQFQQLRQQQMMKQQQQGAGGVWGGGQNGAAAAGMYQKQQETQPVVHSRGGRNPARPLGLSASAWPPLQQAQRQQHQQQQQHQVGSGMRALFLGNPGSKRGCAGTGVFLPRRVGTPTERSETRNKPGSTTVLLPARVVQALNLKLDDMGTAQPRFNGSFSPDGAPRSRNGNLYGHQKRNLRSQQGMSNEVGLPQEWTY